MQSSSNDRSAWPALPLAEWIDTRDTLHLWLQIVGKIRLAYSPPVNHGWHTTFYVTARGLTTSPIPYGTRTFQIDFDVIDHRLIVSTNGREAGGLRLEPKSVAAFYRELMAELAKLGLHVRIHTRPNELPDPLVPFPGDEVHAAYDRGAVERFWRMLVQADRVMKQFRSRFIGKCSPVHLFWGAFDLACTRFSGRPGPEHPGGVPNIPDWAVREAYSHECISAGWWPGGGPLPEPAFYSYSYPEPPAYPEARIRPAEAYYQKDLKEFVLPYEAVRTAQRPDELLLEFFQSTYEAGADLRGWDRPALERSGRS
jgi:hypothetical protein